MGYNAWVRMVGAEKPVMFGTKPTEGEALDMIHRFAEARRRLAANDTTITEVAEGAVYFKNAIVSSITYYG